MPLPSYLFGISEFTTKPWSFEKDIEIYPKLGVDTIELCEVKVEGDGLRDRLAQLRESPLKVSSVQPSVRTLFPSQSMPDPKPIPERMARFRQSIIDLAPSANGAPFVTNTGIPPDANVQQVLDTAAIQYRELAKFAADHGVTLAIEPLNPTIMNIESAIWTLEQAERMVDSVGHEAFGICLDCWNVWQNPDLDAAIRACGDRIFVVQVSDWRTPRSAQDRLIPGDGAIPLAPFLASTYAAGFRGAYSVEIFSHDVPDPLWESDLETVITRSRAGFDAAWQAAFA
jgi:sugar phosphate isomerase/epimerase